MTVRETSSIVLPAPRARVEAALAGRSARPAGPGRFESDDCTFVVLDASGGTRLVAGRRADTAPTRESRDRVRVALEADLRAVRDLVS